MLCSRLMEQAKKGRLFLSFSITQHCFQWIKYTIILMLLLKRGLFQHLDTNKTLICHSKQWLLKRRQNKSDHTVNWKCQSSKGCPRKSVSIMLLHKFVIYVALFKVNIKWVHSPNYPSLPLLDGKEKIFRQSFVIHHV